MSLTESLTIRILGDSSGLRRELEDVASQIDGLQSRLSGEESLGRELGASFAQLEQVVRPLEVLGQAVDRVRGQLLSLSSLPVTLNVIPALGALQQLMAGIQQAAMQIQLLGTFSGGMAAAGGRGGPVRGFAVGGLVSGPGGTDQVPARLTAGEFVLSREAVNALGAASLERLNRFPASSASTPARVSAGKQGIAQLTDTGRGPARAEPAAATSNITHHTQHFGGISIHVREAADVDGLLRRLQRSEVQTRNRRG